MVKYINIQFRYLDQTVCPNKKFQSKKQKKSILSPLQWLVLGKWLLQNPDVHRIHAHKRNNVCLKVWANQHSPFDDRIFSEGIDVLHLPLCVVQTVDHQLRAETTTTTIRIYPYIYLYLAKPFDNLGHQWLTTSRHRTANSGLNKIFLYHRHTYK